MTHESSTLGGSDGFIIMEIFLRIRAGHCGVFAEPELLYWLRGSQFQDGKILIVQPVEALESAGDKPRMFRSCECRVPFQRVKGIVDALKDIGFPGRQLEISDTSDPMSIWWSDVMLQVTIDDRSAQLEVKFGPEGLRGADALALEALFRTLFQLADLKGFWVTLLTDDHSSDERAGQAMTNL